MRSIIESLALRRVVSCITMITTLISVPSCNRPYYRRQADREVNCIIDHKSMALGEAAVLLGDPARVNTDLARLQAVTAADVQRVMKKYFTDANRMVIYYLPESTKQPKQMGEVRR